MRITQAEDRAALCKIRERETPRGDRIGTEFSNAKGRGTFRRIATKSRPISISTISASPSRGDRGSGVLVGRRFPHDKQMTKVFT